MKRSVGKISKKSRALGRAKRDLTIPRLISGYSIGQKVAIDLQSKYPGMPHPRYRGKTGTIISQRGDAYVVQIRDFGAVKNLIVPPVHLKAIKSK